MAENDLTKCKHCNKDLTTVRSKYFSQFGGAGYYCSEECLNKGAIRREAELLEKCEEVNKARLGLFLMNPRKAKGEVIETMPLTGEPINTPVDKTIHPFKQG